MICSTHYGIFCNTVIGLVVVRFVLWFVCPPKWGESRKSSENENKDDDCVFGVIVMCVCDCEKKNGEERNH